MKNKVCFRYPVKFFFIPCLLFFSLMVKIPGAAAQSPVNEVPFTIPAVHAWQGDTGSYVLPAQIRIVLTPQDQHALLPYITIFRNDLAERYRNRMIKVEVSENVAPRNGDILFALSSDTAQGPEAYHMVINNSIHISGPAKGCFWATRTILQILEQSPEHGTVPRGSITDFPHWPIRGFVLDAGRKFFPMAFLREYVKFMSYYKMSDFHVHLNDGAFKQFYNNNWDSTYSAFRLESSTYPALTAKDGHYTKAEFIALQELADSFCVNIIPEIDVPAHSLAFTKVFPEIGSSKYGKDHLDLNNPKTYEVIDNVFKEYLQGPNPVFRGEVHIGTDEYSKAESEKFRSFMNHYIDLVHQYGKKARMWGSLTNNKGETQVRTAGVTMNLWYNGYADPKEMLKLGYDVISTPDGWLYIVPAAGYYYDYLNTKNLYNKWTPAVIGDQVFDENNTQIKGGSFAVWNDHAGNGITAKDVHDRVFPAMQVLAEKMWTGKGQRMNYDTFSIHATRIGEGPGLNISGKLPKDSLLLLPASTNDLVFHHTTAGKYKGRQAVHFNAADSYVKTNYVGIGYDYTVSFYVWPEKGNQPDAVLFSSPDAVVKLKQQAGGKLGFSREDYHYSFNYAVPEKKWTHIVITGNHKGTTLYADGVLVEKLEGHIQEFPGTKSKRAIVQTLFFPLQYIGGTANSFNGYISDLKIYNKVLPVEKVTAL